MDKHVLLTVSDDPSCLCSLRFVCGYFQHTQALHVTLLYVAPNPRAGLSEADIVADFPLLARREATIRQQAEEALTRAAAFMTAKGFPAANIHKKVSYKQFGTATDIIQEGLAGIYDAIGLGRRGISRLEELLSESVSKQVFVTPMDIPLWVSRSTEKPLPHALLCTDGSPASLRCADHLAYMLRDEPQHQISVAYIARSTAGEQIRFVLHQARDILLGGGIAPERIHEIVLDGEDPAETILHHTQEVPYGVVGLGRTGKGETHSLHLLGSVSMRLFRHLHWATLWICH